MQPIPVGLPVGQTNAHLPADVVMRAGLPQRGGQLAYHAFNREYPAMVSAQAFWDAKSGQFKVPAATDLSELDWALDSAGFTAMKLWGARGRQPGIAGVYPWSLTQYIELASLVSPAWYSAPDFCVEPEICAVQEEVDYRVDATATLLQATLAQVHAWQAECARDMSADAVANLIRIPTPIIQGWSVSDYERSLDLTLQVWERWMPWVAMPTLIGVGSVCRRHLEHPTHGLKAILTALGRILPASCKLHLFGVKGSVLAELGDMPFVASVDSMAWDFSARVKARDARVSNTYAHRIREMSAWMEGAAMRMRARASVTVAPCSRSRRAAGALALA